MRHRHGGRAARDGLDDGRRTCPADASARTRRLGRRRPRTRARRSRGRRLAAARSASSSQPSSRARIAATRGATTAPRSASSGLSRSRRDSTSSTDRASSWRAAQATSASRNGRPGTSGRSRSSSRAEGDDGRRLGAMPRRRARAASGCDRRERRDRRRAPRRSARARRRRRRRRGGARRSRSAAPRAASRPRAASIDVAGHDPVGRVLAAADADDAVRLDRDAVLARCLDGRAARRRDQRPQAGVRADHVVPPQVDVEGRVDRREQLVDLPAVGRGSARAALVRRVGRADQPVVGPRDEEHDLARDPDRQAGAGSGSAPAGRRGGRRGSAGSASTAARTGGPGRRPRRRSRRRPARARISSSRAGQPVARLRAPRACPEPDRRQAGRSDPRHGHGPRIRRERRPQRPRA